MTSHVDLAVQARIAAAKHKAEEKRWRRARRQARPLGRGGAAVSEPIPDYLYDCHGLLAAVLRDDPEAEALLLADRPHEHAFQLCYAALIALATGVRNLVHPDTLQELLDATQRVALADAHERNNS
jgi:hypothetical protein